MSTNAPPPPPPPRRRDPGISTPSSDTSSGNAPTGWRSKISAKSSSWGKVAVDKSMKLSDNIGAKVNNVAEKHLGTEHFWPVTGDMPQEMDKCARILRAFTVEGIVKEEADPNDHKKKHKVLRKIPASVIAQAKGLAIFTSFRSGIAPLGGAGGSGVVVAKLPDGTWSAPSGIMPQNLSAGLLIGVDIYDCVLVIRSQAALDTFGTHKVTLGTEIAVAAGPYGAGAAVESGKEKAPVFSYVRSRGLFAGLEVVGQIFVERTWENAALYHWNGIKARDILTGKVKVPPEAALLQQALHDAETRRAQASGPSEHELDSEEDSTKLNEAVADGIQLNEGEVLHLPPTPDQTDGHEGENDPDTVRLHRSSISISRDNSSPSSRRSSVGHIPPPLPSRPRPRPELIQLASSESNYSHDQSETMPPAYYSTTTPQVDVGEPQYGESSNPFASPVKGKNEDEELTSLEHDLKVQHIDEDDQTLR